MGSCNWGESSTVMPVSVMGYGRVYTGLRKVEEKEIWIGQISYWQRMWISSKRVRKTLRNVSLKNE